MINCPKKENYILSLWFRGVSVFVADVHLNVYKKLEVIYIIDNGTFKQYFSKKAYEQALSRGLAFYSDKYAFDNYRKKLECHCNKFKEFFKTTVQNKKAISQETLITFFEHTIKLCKDYTKMNFEFTDKAFSHQDKNPIIKKNLLDVAKFKDYIRDFMNLVLFEEGGYSNQLFTILGKQFNISSSVIHNLTQKEILELFENKKPDVSVISKRQEAFVEIFNQSNFYEGKKAKIIIDDFKEDVLYSDIIKGQAANRGKATGNVKIISVDYGNLSGINKEIEKMGQGDILVAETTAPELIIACKKAGAIITDMGGLMSHAAIVSREFGIPCIIGTKIATQLLSDGDIVEVDANKGIVKILKKDSKK